MITILLPTTASTYLVIVDGTPVLVSGDPDTVQSDLTSGFVFMENSGLLLTESRNGFILES